MKVLTSTPFVASTGTVLPPASLNDGFSYARNAIVDVATRRWQLATLVLPFYESAVVPYTNGSSAETRSYRFTPPVTMTIERAFVHGNLVSANEVQVYIATAAGALPSGATLPLLVVPAQASAAVDAFDINPERVTLDAGTTYVISVSGAGAYTLSRFDVVLHCRTDRWIPAGVSTQPTLAPPTLTDASPRDATVVAALQAAQTAAAALFATSLLAPAPTLVVAPQLSSAAAQRFYLPYFDTARATAKLVRFELFVVPAFVGTPTTITALVLNGAGATVATLSVTYTGTSLIQTATTVASIQLRQAVTGITADPTADWSVQFSSSSATAVLKAYAMLWVSR